MADALKSDYIPGPAVSAADFTLYPFTALLKRIDQTRPGHKAYDLVPDRLRSWMNRIETLPYFSRIYPPHWKPVSL